MLASWPRNLIHEIKDLIFCQPNLHKHLWVIEQDSFIDPGHQIWFHSLLFDLRQCIQVSSTRILNKKHRLVIFKQLTLWWFGIFWVPVCESINSCWRLLDLHKCRAAFRHLVECLIVVHSCLKLLVFAAPILPRVENVLVFIHIKRCLESFGLGIYPILIYIPILLWA